MSQSRRQQSRRNKRNNKKQSRRNNKKQNQSRRNKRQNGGAYNAGALSLAQGQEYRELHKNQYGGGQIANPAPVGDTGMLDPALRQMAGVSTLDRSLTEIAGMRDGPDAVVEAPAAPAQAGGRRKSRGKKSKARKASKKSKKSKKSKARKGSKKQRGGSPAAVTAPTMLLSRMDAARAGTADFSNPWLTK